MDVKRYVGLNGVNIGYWDGDWKYHRLPKAYPYGVPLGFFQAEHKPDRKERKAVARLFSRIDSLFGDNPDPNPWLYVGMHR